MAEPDLELEARGLIVTVEDRGDAKALVLKNDDVSVEILSEPGPRERAAGGYEELAREAGELGALLRRGEVQWWTAPEVTTPDEARR